LLRIGYVKKRKHGQGYQAEITGEMPLKIFPHLLPSLSNCHQTYDFAGAGVLVSIHYTAWLHKQLQTNESDVT